jgi:hypothetical protein
MLSTTLSLISPIADALVDGQAMMAAVKARFGKLDIVVSIGLYLIVTSQYSSTTLYQVSYHIQ